MYYINEPTETERESEWHRFERTGSILSYLRYKGIYTDGTEAEDSVSNMRDGEPIGYN